MKKSLIALISVLLAAVMCFSFISCSKAENSNNENNNKADEATVTDTLPTVLDTSEYVLYQNIFFNDVGANYENTPVTKKGTFTCLTDKYNNVVRYYVWGYNDQTKCCDWQWELNITDASDLPSNGSLVEVSGEFVSNEAALDGYWIDNPVITVTKEYKGPQCDVDMTAMSATLERVQIMNMQQFPQEFEDNTVYAYGRIASSSSIQHPYYDNSWVQEFSSADEISAIGNVVIVSGKYQNGIIADGKITPTDLY